MNKLIAIMIFMLAAVFGTSLAGAQSALVTDYANYPDTPQAELPEGCDSGGLYRSEQFSLNDGPWVSDPAELDQFNAGDKLTMTWSDNTPECMNAPVALIIKVSEVPEFDYSKDQFAYVPYALTYLTGGPGSLTYVLPDLAPFKKGCNFQFDAIVGIPLAVVGPGGSDYSEGWRSNGHSRTTVIAWRNGAYKDCLVPAESTTTTTTAADVPSTTTTSAPPEAPTATTVAAPVTVATELPTPAAIASQPPTAAPLGTSSTQLAVTGFDPRLALVIVAILIAGGAAIVMTTRHKD